MGDLRGTSISDVGGRRMAGWCLRVQCRRTLSGFAPEPSSAHSHRPRPLQYPVMPLTVFDIKGVPGTRHERIEAAVVAGGRHARGPHEAWIAADPFNGDFRVLITGPHGFERTVTFRVRETMKE